MRALHVLTALGPGGAEVWLLNMIEPIRRLGVTMDFAEKAPHIGTLQDVARSRGALVHHVPLRATQVGYVRGLRRLLITGRYDVLHLHDFVYSGLGVLAARLAGVPSVLTLHHYTFEPQTPFTRRFGVRQVREAYGRLNLRYALANADAVTALSKMVMREMVPGYATNPRCHFLRLSTELREPISATQRIRMRESLGVDPASEVVVHAGRFIEQKNHAGLLRVFRDVRVRRPKAVLLLMGHGPLQETILGSAKDLIDQGAVRFLGLRDDVHDIFSASDVMLFPSSTEGFGLVALEANACGIPVVGTRIPGLDEAVVDGETARLFDIANEVGMADAVVELLEQPARARAIGEAGRRRGADFSHEKSAELVASLYASLLEPTSMNRAGAAASKGE